MNWDDVIIDAAATDTGMRRSNNQDSYTIVHASPEAWRQRGHVFLVADGMGAHAVGELASKIACDRIPHNYMKTRAGTPAEAIVMKIGSIASQPYPCREAKNSFVQCSACRRALRSIGSIRKRISAFLSELPRS